MHPPQDSRRSLGRLKKKRKECDMLLGNMIKQHCNGTHLFTGKATIQTEHEARCRYATLRGKASSGQRTKTERAGVLYFRGPIGNSTLGHLSGLAGPAEREIQSRQAGNDSHTRARASTFARAHITRTAVQETPENTPHYTTPHYAVQAAVRERLLVAGPPPGHGRRRWWPSCSAPAPRAPSRSPAQRHDIHHDMT